MNAFLSIFTKQRWQPHGGWLVSLLLHAAMLSTLAMLALPKPTGNSQLPLQAQFSTRDTQAPFETTVEVKLPKQTFNPSLAASNHAPITTRLAGPGALSQVTATWGIGSLAGEGGMLGASWGESIEGLATGGFFGISAQGNSFVYIVDASGSMDWRRFRRARGELIRSLERLRSDQQFSVIFFNDLAYPMPMSNLVPANAENLKIALRWIKSLEPNGGTRPENALQAALELKPDAIYFLSDGQDFRPQLVEELQQANAHRTVIHTIAFENPGGEPLLRILAQQSGGHFRFVR